MFNVLKRTAAGAARNVLLTGAVALLVTAGAGVANAAPPGFVPELSPGAVGGAMTLLAGGLLLLRERLRK